MSPALSLRARLFGAVSERLLKPVLSAPPHEMRRQLERIARLITWLPRGTTIEPATLGGRPAERVVPAAHGDRAILYFHGGAYLGGSPRTHRGLLAHLAKVSGCIVHALDYRLAPEHPYPAAREDGVAAWQALLADGHDPTRLVIGGDSAGGNLALATTLALRDAGLPLPARLLLLSPWTDLGSSGGSMASRAGRERILTVRGIDRAARTFAAGRPLDDPGVSPLFADLAGLPPMLIQVGDDELLLDDSLRLAAAARTAGVAVRLSRQPGLWHVWQAMAGWMPEADAAVAELAAFATEALDP